MADGIFEGSASRSMRWWPGRDDLALAIQLGLFNPPSGADGPGWILGGDRPAPSERRPCEGPSVAALDAPAD